jgi:hypothetical protein
MKRFWDKVNKTPTCWEWTGCTHPRGYGEIIMKIGKKWKARRAHRISYEMEYGAIPSDFIIMHKCDNRICVRPDHLRLGTVADNQADMKEKGRSRNAGGVGEKSSHHKLTDLQVLEIRKRYAAGETNKRILGLGYDLTRTSIYYIVTRKQWNHI